VRHPHARHVRENFAAFAASPRVGPAFLLPPSLPYDAIGSRGRAKVRSGARPEAAVKESLAGGRVLRGQVISRCGGPGERVGLAARGVSRVVGSVKIPGDICDGRRCCDEPLCL
jgi:hypothetical protein